MEKRGGGFVDILLSFSGEEYVGGFLHDQRHGKGTYKYTNGDRYEGMFENDVMHGDGVMIHPDGTRVVQRYAHGVITH